MRAARIHSYGGPDVVVVDNIPVPEPGPGQVLIESHGSSVNPVDIAVRSGWMAEYMPLSPPFTLGIDVAGIVTAVGDGVTEFSPGDRVYGAGGVVMGGSGALAEHVVALAGTVAAAPTTIDLRTAATLPLAAVSALEAIEETLDVAEGDTLFVHGGSGGVGRWAIALAKARGATVIASARGDGVDAAKMMGADEVVDTNTTDFTGVASDLDRAFILVRGDDGNRSLTMMKEGGKVVSLVSPLDEAVATERGLAVAMQGTMVTCERLARLAAFIDSGAGIPHISAAFALDDVRSALAAVEAGGLHGKAAVQIG